MKRILRVRNTSRVTTNSFDHLHMRYAELGRPDERSENSVARMTVNTRASLCDGIVNNKILQILNMERS